MALNLTDLLLCSLYSAVKPYHMLGRRQGLLKFDTTLCSVADGLLVYLTTLCSYICYIDTNGRMIYEWKRNGRKRS